MNNFIEANQRGNTYIDNKIFYDSNVTPTEKNLYCVIASACYENKTECYPSQQTLSKAINRSVRTVQRCLKNLATYGYIKIKRRGSISNVYTIVGKIIKQKVEKVVEGVKQAKNAYKNKTQNFNNFEQRKYNFAKLEAALLGNAKYEYEELLE